MAALKDLVLYQGFALKYILNVIFQGMLYPE